MKHLLIIAKMLLSFSFTKAQGKMLSVDSWGDAKSIIGSNEHSAAAAAYILLF